MISKGGVTRSSTLEALDSGIPCDLYAETRARMHYRARQAVRLSWGP